jgi:membrane-bound lytic murein transglycosylase A
VPQATAPALPPDDGAPLPPPIQQSKSRWVPVRWADLPGFADDCAARGLERLAQKLRTAGACVCPLCGEVRRLSIAGDAEQRAWMRQRLQPYRVEPLTGTATGAHEGLLTSYYEPLLDAMRQPTATHTVPLYRRRPRWRSASPGTRGKRWRHCPRHAPPAWARDCVSGRPGGRADAADPGLGPRARDRGRWLQRLVRLAFAATNDQPYRSVGNWLLQQGLMRDASWPGIKAWTRQNPQR